MDADTAHEEAGARPAADNIDRIAPGPVALALVATVLGVPIVPVIAGLALNRRFQRRHPRRRPFRWGYAFCVFSIIGGVGLGILLDAGVGVVIACGAIYAGLAWFFARRHHWAWMALTVLSLNPVAWVVNPLYLRKRWAEDAVGA
jgi:hypothetical protein